ncbi:hypothetical protein [Gabonibacter chumensis]|uniref:hypothetical protein n=1 Tax=Gabonibacter chumensis TaxID=2972474 RepID=UPI002573F002|nr:hypothetical protein [Gabonibacter chumensis]MCR9011549.1 hypothetical protein [Gabonibacter chumensis]
MKKFIYIILSMLAMVSCIHDESGLGGKSISRLSFVQALPKEYLAEKLSQFVLEAPEVKQESQDKPLSYEWQIDYEVVSTEKTLSYDCNTAGEFPCRLKVYNEDGALFYEFALKVPYPYEEGVAVLSAYKGESMVSFRNVIQGKKVFQKNVYRLNSPLVALGKEPKSILYNADYASIYIATENPVRVVRADARTMEVQNVLKYPEPRVERMIEKGKNEIYFVGGGRFLSMDCKSENYVNTFQQFLTHPMMGMLPGAYVANHILYYAGSWSSKEIIFDQTSKSFIQEDYMMMQVYDDISCEILLDALPAKNFGEGVIIFKDDAGQIRVADVGIEDPNVYKQYPEMFGNMTENSRFLTSKKETHLYYSHENEIYIYDYQSNGNFPTHSAYSVGEVGDVIKDMVFDPDEEKLYVALDAVSGDYKGCVYCYDVKTRELLWHERGVAGAIVQMIYKK